MRGTRSHLMTVTLATLCLASCGDTSGPAEQPATVSLSGPASEVTIGGTVQLAAAVLNATGALMSGQQVQWSSLDTVVASVSASGLMTGLAGGTATIRAVAGTASGTLSLLVKAGPCSPTTITGTLTTGQTVNGSLTVSDCIFMEGGHADGWTFTVTQATTARIDLTGTSIDGTLLVTDLAMNIVAWGDRTAADSIRVVHQFAPGSYIVWVSGWGTGGLGPYSLSVTSVTMCSAASAVGSLAMDQVATGSITQGSCLLPHGHPGVGWRFSASTAATVRVVLSSIGFMPLIVATDLNLNPVAVSAPGGTTSGTAEFIASLPPGEYVIWATSVGGGTGIFSLSMAPAQIPPCSLSGGTVAVGQTVSGTLTPVGCRLPDGRFADAWQLTLPTAASLRIDMTSSQLDPFLMVTDADGRILAIDDDGGFGYNARIVHSFTAGTYIVWTTTFSMGEAGSYQLTVQPAAAGNAQAVQSSARQAAPSSARQAALSSAPPKRSWPARW